MAVSITAFVNCKLFSTILSEKNNWNPSKGVLTYFAATLGLGFFLKIFATVLFFRNFFLLQFTKLYCQCSWLHYIGMVDFQDQHNYLHLNG